MAAAESQTPTSTAPPLLGWPLAALPLRARLGVGLLLAAAMVVAAIFASHAYPHTTVSASAELEQRIAEVDHDPTVVSWDNAVIGDLLIERFYILDTTTGERYISDFLKGRISGIQVVKREDEPAQDVLL
ncbi:MAG TPA: hypothetical protein VH951_05400, partial [Dehalococcoidia bacterium]